MKIGVLGAGGRMGQMVVREILQKGHPLTLSGACELVGHPDLGKDAGECAGYPVCHVQIIEDVRAVFESSTAVIDFTAPSATLEHAALASEFGTALVVGTTGLDSVSTAALRVASQKAPIVYASNYSLGVALITAFAEKAAQVLNDDYDIEIFEAHHRYKKDAPSGTALTLGEACARGRDIDFQTAVVAARNGDVGERVKGSIGLCVFRGGDVVGEHSVVFAGLGERIELAHKASDRAIFARGAVQAALWASEREPGLYSVRDVLGL